MDLKIKPLVADYNSFSDDDEIVSIEPGKENHTAPLISATETLDQNTGHAPSSVFTNPYKIAEKYEQSVLEKHVKMTQVKDIEPKIKKICYKFNKGKCRLGDKCHYLHHNPVPKTDLDAKVSDDDEPATTSRKSKKRCGVKDDLLPPKKYMKTYNQHK